MFGVFELLCFEMYMCDGVLEFDDDYVVCWNWLSVV